MLCPRFGVGEGVLDHDVAVTTKVGPLTLSHSFVRNRCQLLLDKHEVGA